MFVFIRYIGGKGWITVQLLVLEQQRSEMTQTAPPRLPFVRRVKRFVIDVFDTGFLQALVHGAAASNHVFSYE
jgi:hypothetical protein